MRTETKTNLIAVLLPGLVLLLSVGPARAATYVAVDTASTAGLAYSGETWLACSVDTDVDGWPDVYLGQHDQGGRLLHNNGNGTYTRVAASAWPRVNPGRKIPDRHGCAWADFDRNGLPDVHIGSGRGSSNPVKVDARDNELWLQQSRDVFAESGTAKGMGDPCGRSHYSVALDVNKDGWSDVVVGNAPPRGVVNDPCTAPGSTYPDDQSKLYLNQGGTGFTDASRAFGVRGNFGVRCLQAVDFNNDGWTDIVASAKPGIVMLRNNDGTGFTDVSAAMGTTTGSVNQAEMGDLNRDGRLDLVVVASNQLTYRLGTATGLGPSVRVVATSSGRAIALGDADGDGALDIYLLRGSGSASSNPSDLILLNRSLAFTTMAVPAATGMGDAVVATDGNRDGLAEFVVLNGLTDAGGPLQLISLRTTV